LGNECDLSFAHFLTYLGKDTETRIIGGYLENIKNGAFFLRALRNASLEKPVILWKQGLNPEGCQAASSHTGALTGNKEIWKAVVRQSGAVPVVGFEPWVDAIMGFSLLPHDLGDRVTIISGPGGLAVSAAEACGNVGLRLAELSSQTRSKLSEFVSPTGTSLKNPVDVGMTAALDIEIYIQAAQIVAEDPGVDGLMIMGSGLNPETNRIYTNSLIKIHQNANKPFIMVSIPGFDPELAQAFCQAGIPCFDSAERALSTYSLVRKYQLWRKAIMY
jgi:acyl-CoA synthetase (NDP forming)